MKRQALLSSLRRVGYLFVGVGIIALTLTLSFRRQVTQEVRSRKPRAAPSQISTKDYTAFLAGLGHLSMALSKTLAAPNHNFVVSPASLTAVLGMAYAGAAGNTAREISIVLADTQPSREQFHACVNRLAASIASSQSGPMKTKEGDKQVELRWAGALWLQQGTPIESRFLDTLNIHYDSGVRLVDFAKGSDSAAATLNRWAADQTHGRIAKIVSPAGLSRDTRALLTQAVYLSASWAVAFPRGGTYDADFRKLDGSAAPVPTMHKTLSIPYAQGDGFKAIALPYVRSEWSMLVVLPESQRFDDVQSGLSTEWFQDLRSRLRERRVAVALPKFKVHSDVVSLRAALETLGIHDAFSTKADFTGMSSSHFVYLADMSQRAMVEVDELGTQAAAVTVARGMIVGTENPSDLEEFRADHPFLFFVVDRNGFVLFAGQLVDPAQHSD